MEQCYALRNVMVYVFLADGCEEIEALAPVDVMRRAGIETVTVGVPGNSVMGAHDIEITADIAEGQMNTEGLEAIVLPGGLPGTTNLEASDAVQRMIDYCVENDILIGAICAAPSILGNKGLLKGKTATAFPSFQKFLSGALLSDEYVCRDGNIITARGMGVSLQFGAKLIEAVKGADKAAEIMAQIQFPG